MENVLLLHGGMYHLHCDREEADTKLLLPAIDVLTCGAITIQIYSPDTDARVLALTRYPQLCDHTVFVTGVGQNCRIIPLKPIFTALGEEQPATLPEFHAMSAADNTDSFYGKEKPIYWEAFYQRTRDIFPVLLALGTNLNVPGATLAGIERLVCNLQPRNTQVKNFRWRLFKNTQAESPLLHNLRFLKASKGLTIRI